ncbi:hypothetical protein C6H66_24335 [Photorhabdus hindustanensis]|uniref:Phage tail collar domain-containing protein n=2 Tax=Photorhabdus TaxID=29487 RepID=A0A2S8PTX3_9GAMM|nr:phage tail protein [Photorhabdus hindustanensis]PQQ22255.1 hypothetical protein C6H66_24335 [Photorhabdus hindustanensis]
MQKIGDITNTADKNGEFTNGNVAAGIAPTLLDAGWFNTIQRELINAIQGAGIKLDNKNDSQLFAAIKKQIDNSAVEIHDASLTQKGITQLTDKTGNSNTLAATQKLVTDVNDNANSKLSKSQNGADIPDKNAFVKNLGLAETVNKAKNTYSKSESDNRFIQLNTNTKTSGYILSKTANYCDDPNSRHLGRSGFLRTDGIDNLGDLAIHIAHSSANSDSSMFARGISFRYGDNFGISTYAFDKAGKFAGSKRILTEDDVIVPVGVPLPYPHRYTPPGYLTCNGQTFDKSLYPKLAEAYPDGRVPDLRGEFIRGWDDSRGVDPGRVCGTWQGDAIRNITGSWGDATAESGGDASGAFNYTYRRGGRAAGGGGGTLSFTFDASRVVPTANENRPRNVAFNYIVRAA